MTSLKNKMMFDLSDKVVLLTGAGQKVGYGIACVLAKFGATIIACDESKEKADRTCEAIFNRGGIGIPVSFDLTDRHAIENALHNITDKLGEIDIMIYNAGTAAPGELSSSPAFGSMKKEDWLTIIDVHLRGFLNCCQVVLRPMVSKNWGRIIKINSSLEGFNNGGAYSAAGGQGAIGFVKQLAKETSSNGITCNAITLEWRNQSKTKAIPYLSDMFPYTHRSNEQDPGYLSLYLSTESASWISGQTIPLEITY